MPPPRRCANKYQSSRWIGKQNRHLACRIFRLYRKVDARGNLFLMDQEIKKMALLDLLLEKKDLKAYIDFRIAALRDEDRKVILNLSPEKRGFAHVRIAGRIAELIQLGKVISQGTLKERSKTYCTIVKNKITNKNIFF